MGSSNLNKYGIDDKNLILVSEWAKDYAVSKGILMRSHEYSKDTRVLLPICVVPSVVPEKWFHLANELQPYLNEVLFKISHSREFLKSCLARIVEVDEFTANIFKIYEAIEDEDSNQLTLGLIRSDYLLDSDSSGNIIGIKQVENNTIAASFGGLSPSIQDLHKYILSRLGKKSLINQLPANNSVSELSIGLVAAWRAYGSPSAVVLFIVEENTLNICDQRALEHTIIELNSSIEILRYSFKDLRTSVKLKGKILFVEDKEVAVAYYRTGYVPKDYEKKDWKIRLLIEQSHAIKCPSVGLHLAGTKTVQSLLTSPGVLEKFIDPDIAERLRQVFANQYSLNKEKEGDKAIIYGIENPNKYVLKPEREGGGNNIYGSEVRTVLDNIKTTNERDAYILMERINPPFLPNCIIQRDQLPEMQDVICELGIFGVILGNKKQIMLNNSAGHLLRSKRCFQDETGVAAGFGALDSPLLN